MEMRLHQVVMPLEHPFTIARGSITDRRSLIVELNHDGLCGYGEVAENSYYGHTIDALSNCLEAASEILPNYLVQTPSEVWQAAYTALGENRFALSALDMAAHDLAAQLAGLPTYRFWELDWDCVPDSSYTIGIDDVDKMVQKLAERPDWPIYKIKLGTDRDLDIIRELRKHTDAAFRVDANCGWTADQTVQMSQELKPLDVEFIEQPLPADASESDKRRVYTDSALPIIADESCIEPGDVARCHGLFHGINVKVCKCGGLTPAKNMLIQARELGMKTMVGCMIESSVAISAASHLLPLLDYADLDGSTLIRRDPAVGVSLENGVVTLANRHGHGAELIR